jgi:hypothetical protein
VPRERMMTTRATAPVAAVIREMSSNRLSNDDGQSVFAERTLEQPVARAMKPHIAFISAPVIFWSELGATDQKCLGFRAHGRSFGEAL